jgi:hypothetical protein
MDHHFYMWASFIQILIQRVETILQLSVIYRFLYKRLQTTFILRCLLITMLNTLISILLSTTPVIANPYVVKCTTVEGYPLTGALTVDLDQKTVSWGVELYIITDITDEYITAMHNDHELLGGTRSANTVGGEVFVLNRLTGVYKRAWVGLFCKYCPTPPNEKEDRSTVLRADTHTGKCMRPMF